MVKDKEEWEETYNLIYLGNDSIVSHLSLGEFVTIKKELFDNLVREVNDFRFKTGDLEEGVELITMEKGIDNEEASDDYYED